MFNVIFFLNKYWWSHDITTYFYLTLLTSYLKSMVDCSGRFSFKEDTVLSLKNVLYQTVEQDIKGLKYNNVFLCVLVYFSLAEL